tara:strand:+ start:334 stop:768 length:435 start_codon:yes stop_codon:yes gene_type:complete
MTNIITTEVKNTITNIAAFGRASVTRFEQSGDIVYFDIDTCDVLEVTAVAKTLAKWLDGKYCNIYVERFCSTDCTTIAIENPIMTQDEDGVKTDRQGRVREGASFVEEMNTHEADGMEIATYWDQTKSGAFRDWVGKRLVGAEG